MTARYRRPHIGSTTSCTQAPWRSVSLPLTGKAHAVPPHAARNWLCSPKRLLGGGRGGIDRPVDLRCADRNINHAPARKLQRDRQNILLRDVAICAHHVAQCHRGPCTTSARASRQPPPGRSSPGTRFRVERHEQACAPRRAGMCAQSRAFVTRSVQVSRVLIARCDLAQCDLARPGVSAEHLRVSCALPVSPGSLRCWPLKRCSPVLGNIFSCFK